MIIKDDVHGIIEFSGLEQKIIDSPAFQRLRRIKQIAFTYLVYPGATHTRFEHSLGTAHLAGAIAVRLGLDGDTVAKVRLAGLLHDIGHTAFSHDGERALLAHLGDHEKLGKKIMRTELRPLLQENYSPQEILDIYEGSEGQIITSDLGADRMDYLSRDARNTGVAYGIVDIDRLVHTLRMERNALCIGESGLEAAESLLVARFMMFSTVYLHRTVRIASAMLRRAIAAALEEHAVAAEDFLTYSDDEMLLRMRTGKAKYWTEGLLARQLYKEAGSLPTGNKSASAFARLEQELSEKHGCEVLVDYPYGFFKPIGIQVKGDAGLQPLTALSPLVKTLAETEAQRQRVLVLCPEEKRDAIHLELIHLHPKANI